MDQFTKLIRAYTLSILIDHMSLLDRMGMGIRQPPVLLALVRRLVWIRVNMSYATLAASRTQHLAPKPMTIITMAAMPQLLAESAQELLVWDTPPHETTKRQVRPTATSRRKSRALTRPHSLTHAFWGRKRRQRNSDTTHKLLARNTLRLLRTLLRHR